MLVAVRYVTLMDVPNLLFYVLKFDEGFLAKSLGIFSIACIFFVKLKKREVGN